MSRSALRSSDWLAPLFVVVLAACGSSGGHTGAAGSSGAGGVSASGGAGGSGTGGAPSTGGSAGSGAAGSSSGGSAGAAGSGGAASSWRPFNDQSPWNTPIPASASIDPNSTALIQDLAASATSPSAFWINIPQYSIPVYWVDSKSTPMVTVQASVGGTGFRNGATDQNAAAGSGPAPIPAGATPAAGTDKHLAIVDRSANMEWGFWLADDSSGSWTAGAEMTMDLSGSGVRPSTLQTPWWAGQGARACGYALIAGLITQADIESGVIDHALIVAYPHIRSRYFTSPASSAQGTTNDALPERGIPCGGHIQLDPSLDVTTLGLSPAGLAIAKALQKYGAFVGDYSGAISLYADASAQAQAYWNSGKLQSSSAEAIPLDRLRVLTLGTLSDNNN
jgi:hypothetical protein